MISPSAFLLDWKIAPLLAALIVLVATAVAVSGEPERVAAARSAKGAAVRELCRAAGLGYPPRALFLRAFKDEGAVEAWGRDGGAEYVLIKSYAVTALSGRPGPKRREGDRQIPEGFYFIDAFNPISLFHLSMRVNYPNASDRILSDRERPGADIYIHGGAASIGCLPLGDDAIEELYLLALDVSRGKPGVIPVHLFPTRMSGPSWAEFLEKNAADNPDLAAFWASLKVGYDRFEESHRPPGIKVDEQGRYLATAGR